jgi:MFS transporter, Spinster family, sphingosine-1-phosphate transporter
VIKRPGTILALLTGLNFLNYLDRLVVSAVLPKIQEELGLTNFVGGLLATVFLIGYFVTSPIFGALGDRLPRKHLIAVGVVVWSLATMASGIATGALGLLAARAMVGVGEASYATLAPTIIDDVTTPPQKGRALAVFYIATPVGAAAGYLVGGFIESHWGWRAAFYVAGGPGVVLALVCLLIAEPARKISEKADVLGDVKNLVRMDLYRKGVAGYCAYTAAVGAFSYWAPKFLYARYQMSLAKANFVFGLVLVVAGALGTIIGGRWADQMRAKLEPPKVRPEDVGPGYRDEAPEVKAARELEVHRAGVKGLLRICAIGSGVGAPLALGCFISPDATVFFVLAFFCIVFLFLNTSPVNAVVLQAVPTELRASAMALSIFSIHVFGDLWSPPLVGLLADNMPMWIAMMTLPLAIGLSAFLWWPRRVGAPPVSSA